ncbi:MAG: hypothetical protein IJ200_05655 [Prevotella sp.]|nr:hypothetical protein [Prevotella sp.]
MPRDWQRDWKLEEPRGEQKEEPRGEQKEELRGEQKEEPRSVYPMHAASWPTESLWSWWQQA